MGRDACMILFLQRKIRRRPSPAAGSRSQVEQIGVSISCACFGNVVFLHFEKNVNSALGRLARPKCKTSSPSSIMRRSSWSAARCQAGTSVFLPWSGVPVSAHTNTNISSAVVLFSHRLRSPQSPPVPQHHSLPSLETR